MPDLSEDTLISVWGKAFSRVVCAPKTWTKERVEQEVNRTDHPGTTDGWVISDRDTNPVQCDSAENRWHWLLDC